MFSESFSRWQAINFCVFHIDVCVFYAFFNVHNFTYRISKGIEVKVVSIQRAYIFFRCCCCCFKRPNPKWITMQNLLKSSASKIEIFHELQNDATGFLFCAFISNATCIFFSTHSATAWYANKFVIIFNVIQHHWWFSCTFRLQNHSQLVWFSGFVFSFNLDNQLSRNIALHLLFPFFNAKTESFLPFINDISSIHFVSIELLHFYLRENIMWF